MKEIRAKGGDPYALRSGIRIEDFVLGGTEFQAWLFKIQAELWNGIGLKKGFLTESLGHKLPQPLSPDEEKQCAARAEMLWLCELLPSKVFKKTENVCLHALFGPMKTAEGEKPANPEQIKRILWLKVVLSDGEGEVSDKFRKELAELWQRFWPGYAGETISTERIREWQSWLCSFEAEHPLAARCLALLRPKG